ncbi:MAG: RNA polymerase sigma factor [Bacillota bacterium]|nr:RNA polymerase sigma factor [Bacillota bacterium]
MQEVDLVINAQKGDKKALIEYILKRRDEYYRLAYVYVKNQEDSLDALQEMIVIIFENIRKLKNVDSFVPWSKTILVNCCKNILKKKNKVILVESYQEREFIENYKYIDQSIDIENALERLNFKQREAIKLKYYLGYDYETIAQITKTPIGTVKSRISNGLKLLKKVMKVEEVSKNYAK